MNKIIEDYIEKRKKEMAEAKKTERGEILTRLNLTGREYRKDFPDEPEEHFPYFDAFECQKYRFKNEDISDEEYEELLKYIPTAEKPATENMSGWYYFAIIMMVLGCLGGIIIGAEAESGIVAIASVLGILIFFSQIILLCKIEYNIRSKK